MNYYLLKEDGSKIHYSKAKLLANPEVLNHELRLKIIKELEEKPMFAAELARKLGIHEQKIYYHINQLLEEDMLQEVERKQIRGTTAKKYSPKELNYAYSLGGEWKDIHHLLKKKDTKLDQFLKPFVKGSTLNCDIVVGSPDPHGPYKSYARDGHYATDLALFLGKYCNLPENFTVKLDVDVKAEKTYDRNMIIVGGPGTNIITQEFNDHMPIRFDIKKSEKGFLCSGIKSKGHNTTGEHTGLIARIPNPHNPENFAMILAGYRCIGSKTAVLGLTRHPEVLKTFRGQKEWAAIIDGYDLDGDGKIDSVEIIE